MKKLRHAPKSNLNIVWSEGSPSYEVNIKISDAEMTVIRQFYQAQIEDLTKMLEQLGMQEEEVL